MFLSRPIVVCYVWNWELCVCVGGGGTFFVDAICYHYDELVLLDVSK
jgi:hypothetical protein